MSKPKCSAQQDGEVCGRVAPSTVDFQILRAGWDIIARSFGYIYICPRHASGKDA